MKLRNDTYYKELCTIKMEVKQLRNNRSSNFVAGQAQAGRMTGVQGATGFRPGAYNPRT